MGRDLLSHYRSQRLWANARDGAKIPISIVYHKDTKLSESTPFCSMPMDLGHTIDPSFSSNRLSLLDRGFVFAIAHIRGENTWADIGMRMASY